MDGALYVINSGNSKTSGSIPVDATYLAIKPSCPRTCPLKDNGCYASNSYLGIIVNRLEKECTNSNPLNLARAEAKVIDNAYYGGTVSSGRNLRLHVSGDSRTIAGSKIINAAIGRWKARGGEKVWSYTHAWDRVTKDIWSNVEMLASVDSTDQVEFARQNGYAPAIVVSEHISEKAYILSRSDIKWIPCPAQTKKDVGCADCKLCFNVNRLYNSNMGIAFAAHGIRKNVIKKRLKVIE